MTVNQVGYLTQLLARAISSTEIWDSRRREQIDILQYASALNSSWYTHRPDLDWTIVGRFSPYLLDSVLEQEIIGFLAGELKEKLNEDRVQIATIEILGGLDPGIYLADLLEQLLRVALVLGPSHAATAFFSGVEGHPFLYHRIALLNGVRVEKEIEVSKGIRLVPLPLSSAELPSIFPYMDYMRPSDLLGRTVLIIDFLVSPTFLNPVITTNTVEDSFKHTPLNVDYPDFDVEEYCEALSMSSNGAVQYIALWTHLAHDHVANLQGRATAHRYFPSSHQWTEGVVVTEDRARHALEVYDSRKRLGDDVAKKLKVPIDRWIKSKANQSFIDSWIDIGIALEALFLSDNPGRSELSYRLRLRAAWFLGENVERRVAIEKDLRNIYGLRSSAVHSGNIESNSDTRELKNKAQDYCVDSLLKVIDEGQFPVWNQLVLGRVPTRIQ